MGFAIGFLAGFFANWAFGMVARLLPATWVRYRVRIGHLLKEESLGFQLWTVPVCIEPPTWRRALMEPLREYLLVQLNVDDRGWLQGKWVEGDVNTLRLLADGAMTVSALVLTASSQGVFLSDRFGEETERIAVDGKHTMHIRVVRGFDNKIAGCRSTAFVLEKGKLVSTIQCSNS